MNIEKIIGLKPGFKPLSYTFEWIRVNGAIQYRSWQSIQSWLLREEKEVNSQLRFTQICLAIYEKRFYKYPKKFH